MPPPSMCEASNTSVSHAAHVVLHVRPQAVHMWSQTMVSHMCPQMRLQDQVLAEIDTELTVSGAKAEAADAQLSAAQGEADAARVRSKQKPGFPRSSVPSKPSGAEKLADAQLAAAQGEADAARVWTKSHTW